MKIDIYAHVIPKKCMEIINKQTGKKVPMLEATPPLTNLEERFRIMDRFADLMQVLVPSGEPLECALEPKVTAELVKIYNDELAEMVAKYPDRFAAAVAILPLSDIEFTLQEIDRAITELRFKGIFLQTPVYSRRQDGTIMTKSLDSPEFIPIYEKMVEYNLPIWLHPFRLQDVADYSSESKSRYQIWHVFGWPYVTTAEMARLVFSGILQSFPALKIIIHHAGAMVPFFEQRISSGYGYNEMRFPRKHRVELTKSPLEYFRMFYVDTAINGSIPGLTCAHAFFGSKRMLFGTDMPFDAHMGYLSIKKTIESIEKMGISFEDKEAIFQGNAKDLLNLSM